LPFDERQALIPTPEPVDRRYCERGALTSSPDDPVWTLSSGFSRRNERWALIAPSASRLERQALIPTPDPVDRRHYERGALTSSPDDPVWTLPSGFSRRNERCTLIEPTVKRRCA